MKAKFYLNGMDPFDIGDFGSTEYECVQNVKKIYWRLYLKERGLLFLGTLCPLLLLFLSDNVFLKSLIVVWYMLLRRYFVRRIKVCELF